MTIINAGLNHHTTPIELREKIALSEEQLNHALTEFKSTLGLNESVIISTCNRCEFFSFAEESKCDEILEWTCSYFGLEHTALKDHWVQKKGVEAVHHLMEIACGLDSVIIGEPQILGQVKTAYQIAQKHKHTGTILSRLFDHSITATKLIRSQTDLGRHSISYASIILSIMRNLFDDLSSKKVLVIGVGEMIQLVIKHFKENDINSITIVNRTSSKSLKLAEQYDATTENFNQIENILEDYDIIVSCTTSQTPIINQAMLQNAIKKRNKRPIYIADLAVPRDIEPSANDIEGIYLYSLDNLAKMIEENQRLRMAAGDQAKIIISQRSKEFMNWLAARNTVPLINQYRNQAEIQCEKALNQALRQLEEGQNSEKVIQQLSHTLKNKLMHPMTKLISNATKDKNLVTIIRNILDNEKH